MQNSKIYTFLWALFLIATSSYAQSPNDSIAVVSKAWKTINVEKGIVWKQGHFDTLFKSQQEINFLEIDLRRYKKRLHLAAEPTTLKNTSTMALGQQAIVAINGGFFDTKKGGAVDFIRVNGKTINNTHEVTDRANAFFLCSKKNVEIIPASDSLRRHIDYPNVLLSGPLLIQEQQLKALTKNAFNDNRHPRSAVALTSDNKLILFVVDGRNSHAHGMNLHELAHTLRWLGAEHAMNLDGGGSSSLYIKEATTNGIVNYPSDNKKFDHEGERAVANIIYIK